MRRSAPHIREVSQLTLPLPKVIRLDNGLPVYVLDFPEQEILKLEVVYNAGRPAETKRLVARATARMVQEGTRQKSAAVIAELIDFYGGSLSIPTNLDSANFLLFTLHRHAEKLVPVFAELLHEPAFPENELETFKRASARSLAIDLDKEEVLAYRKITELIFGPDHPYGYNSTPADYAALQQADLIRHFERWFTPANCRIFASGRVDHGVRYLLNQYFGQERRDGAALAVSPMAPKYVAQTIPLKHPGSLQTAVKIGRPLFSRRHPDYNGMYVLNTILGGYFGSRLMRNIREKRGYTYNIYSTVDAMLHDGCFYIATEVDNSKVRATIKQIFAEMERLCEEPIPDAELSMVRNYLLGMLLNGLDGPLNISDVIKTLVTEDLPLDAFDGLVHTIRTITPKQLQKLARRYFKTADFSVVTVGK
ncbi:MAG: insulinase family protein [Lewinellaceae bacterium]|nr:insulinase family protein [Saprospiraceae bacterium]MCB9333806.1 insulinase family protein [Lewinellaceae bacterium]